MTRFLILLLVVVEGGCNQGRRKRSFSEFPDFGNLVARDEDMLCNSPDLRRILQNHMSSQTSSLINLRESAVASAAALTKALESLGERFVLVCSPSHNGTDHLPAANNSSASMTEMRSFSYSLPHEAEFCSYNRKGVACHVFVDPRHISTA